MQPFELLRNVQPTWIDIISKQLNFNTYSLINPAKELQGFFDLLVQAIETDNHSVMIPAITFWGEQFNHKGSTPDDIRLTGLISDLYQLSIEKCLSMLEIDQSQDLIIALAPIFSYCIKKAAEIEQQMKVVYFENRLNEVQQTLEKLDRQKSDFVTVAAHELKTPLTLIEGYSSMLREIATQNLHIELYSELLDGIQSGYKRMQLIANDLIDVAMIDNNLLKLNFQPLWFNRLLAALKAELSSSLKLRNQSLELLEFLGSNEMIFADPERLMQAFRNILTNAIKFTPDGGQITVNGRSISGFVEITISDTGIGIDPENQTIIFSRFGRIGSSSLYSSGKVIFKGGGPGLGLPIAKGVIEAHGGTIWVESLGHDEKTLPGSIFHILIPSRNKPVDEKLLKLFPVNDRI